MKKKFKDALTALIKDYGLSDKAVNELVEQGQAVIADDASEDLVESQANLFANIARTMQGEVTRKVQAVKQPTKPKDKEGGEDNQEKQKLQEPNDDLLNELKAMKEQLMLLQQANEKAAADKAEEARLAIVKDAAKKAGLSDKMLHYYDTSKITTAEEAEQLFADIKQEMVNNNLRPKGADGRFVSNSEAAEKADAEAWAKTLKDK